MQSLSSWQYRSGFSPWLQIERKWKENSYTWMKLEKIMGGVWKIYRNKSLTWIFCLRLLIHNKERDCMWNHQYSLPVPHIHRLLSRTIFTVAGGIKLVAVIISLTELAVARNAHGKPVQQKWEWRIQFRLGKVESTASQRLSRQTNCDRKKIHVCKWVIWWLWTCRVEGEMYGRRSLHASHYCCTERGEWTKICLTGTRASV